MEYTRLGSTGLKVSRLALGCMSYGDPTTDGAHRWALADDEAQPYFAQAVELGITFWDTANVYQAGTSEEVVGRAIKRYSRREDIVLATKVFGKMHDGPGGSGLSRKAVLEQIDASLTRLGTDYVDLYQIHRFDPGTPVAETMEALHDIVKAGKVRYLGASSMFGWQFAKLQRAAEVGGWTPFVSPPGYLWALAIAGITAIPGATSLVLYGGAVRAGLRRRHAVLLAGGAAAVLGGWFTASAVIAGHGWYHARLGHGVPWLPVAAAGFLSLLLALRRIPVVARTLAAPGTVSRLELPHSFRVAEGAAFLLIMALGHLHALFALPAGLGDIAAGIAAPLVALRLAQGTGRRAALWFNAFGMTDLVVALTLGALTGFQLVNVTPSGAPISQLPLALIPTAAVPLLFALHITSVTALRRAHRAPLPATGRRIADATPRAAAASL